MFNTRRVSITARLLAVASALIVLPNVLLGEGDEKIFFRTESGELIAEDAVEPEEQVYIRTVSGELYPLDRSGSKETLVVKTKSGEYILLAPSFDEEPEDLPAALRAIAQLAGGMDSLDIQQDDGSGWIEGGATARKSAPPGLAPTAFVAVAPNPGNPTVSLNYTVGAGVPLPVTLRVYNTLGQVQRTLVDEAQGAGSYLVVWDGLDDSGNAAAAGTYLATLTVGDFEASKKLTLAK